MIAGLLLGILLLGVVGMPLFAVMGWLAVINFEVISKVPLQAMITEIKILMDAPSIVALPIFTFMGYILAHSKASERIVRATNAWLGWLPGGLALSTVIAYTAFCTFTGGSALSVLALGGIYYPAMLKAGYDKNFALGVCTVAGGEGMLFPPSLPVIVMGLIMSQAVDSLYVAAFLPGILVVSIFAGYCVIHSIRQGIPSQRPSLQDMVKTGYEIAPEAFLIVIILGGVFLGWMDITEVATLSLGYVIAIECLIRREVSTKGFFKASIESMTLIGALFAILASALMFANFMVDFEIPQKTLAFVQRFISSKLTFLIALNIILIITGALIDVFSAILVMVPLLLPIATAYGIDPIHFAVIFLWNLQIGYDTPPVGFDLFIGASRFKEPLERVWKAALPRVAVEIIGLLAITYIPAFSLWPLDAFHMRKELVSF